MVWLGYKEINVRQEAGIPVHTPKGGWYDKDNNFSFRMANFAKRNQK